ncbi:MAG: hypothetical protein HKO63_01425 [Acidimicrobiia bacterium]|nr:hypothetical protein [Acidimicrobiia bacterium]MBT8246526.1 hypothetical protein [Acidimicrobiia bacterium]NNF89368.1 hypothetical protein [Acidimicrobiia bacterium]NNJ47556.1 hypothetical protein [Acidimicrobiia bacterium]NNL14768.1 hypothetical protein [Acidimicrobiia bacterium]
MDRTRLVDLVEASDSDGLIRFIDGLCAAREWEGLAEVRYRCIQAESRGRQLFGVVQFVDYRQALEAPAELAAEVVRDGAGRFALGPLWEVAASTHTWAEIGPHLESRRMRTLVAAERALRGESVDGDFDVELLGTPLELMDWEPRYEAATYRSDRADFPAPGPIPLQPIAASGEVVPADDPDSEDALFGLVRTWVEESDGLAHVVTVDGSVRDAIVSAAPGPVDGAPVTFGQALALMGWAGANGGAYGSRRGGPVGRSAAWASVAALADLEWPPSAQDVEAAGTRLEWWRWEPHGLVGGWHLGLAAADPSEGLAWAIHGRDQLNEEAIEAGDS